MQIKRLIVCAGLVLAGCAPAPTEPELETVPEEYWGLPNLVIQAFIPPLILAGEGDTIYLSDLTTNVGENVSEPTTVRYYISSNAPIDVSTALILGEREVRGLKPRESDESLEIPFEIPEGAGGPPLFLAACVDIDDAVTEETDDDNCTNSPAGAGQSIFDSGGVY